MKLTTRRIAVQDSKIRGGIAARLGKFAKKVDRGADIAARVMLANEALYTFVDQLYYFEGDRFRYIDPVNWRILIPCPWGSIGWKASGLRRQEARILSNILLKRARVDSLFAYNDVTRFWHVNLKFYPAYLKACGYLSTNPLTVDEWRI